MAKRGLQFLPRRATDTSPLGASIELGVGDILRMNRERRGQELQSVANQLRIRLAYLEAIEEGRYKDLPGSTYAVGFVRSYGDYLGLDGADIVRRFREEVARIHGRTRLIPPVIAADGSIPPAAMLLLSVVGIGIAYGAWYYLSSSDQTPVPVVQDVPAQMIGAPDAAGTGQPEAQHAPAAGASQSTSGGMPSDSGSADSGNSPSNLSTIMAPEPTTEPVVLPPVPSPSTSGSAAPSTSAPTAPEPAPTATATAPAAETPPPAPPVTEPVPAPAAAQDTTAPAQAADAATAAPAVPAVANPPATAVPPAPPATDMTTPPPAADAATQPPAAAATPSPPAADSTVASPAAPPPSPALPATGTAEPAPSQTAATESTIPSAPALPAAPDSAAADITTATVVPTGTRIQINARLDTWIKIVDHNGRTVLNRVLTAGERYDVPDEAGLKMITGDAGGMDILVDGAAIAPLGEPGKVRRDVELDPEKLKAGTAIPQ